MPVFDSMLHRIGADVRDLQDGLDPQTLAFWYHRIIRDAREMAPPWLVDKINVRQDPILTMKFRLDVSRRAIRHVMAAIEANIGAMPYSTRLYFLRVQESIESETDRSLV